MPIHDWTCVDAGIFHHFHHEWITEISRALNHKLQGTDYYALAEQIAGDWGPDVLALQRPLRGGKRARKTAPARSNGGIALATAPPKLRFRFTDGKTWYALKKKAVTIRHVSGHRVVAVLEILSPGNKSSQDSLSTFTQKVHELLAAGIHVAIVDLFPPTKRNPAGIHPLLWSDEDEDGFVFDSSKPLTCASYVSGPLAEAFVEPVALGGRLPDLPVFLTPREYVPTPLEKTYRAAFEAVPEFWQSVLAETTR
jgi:hypothetical protein